jgi:capsular polysaccharide biosynthesis protein
VELSPLFAMLRDDLSDPEPERLEGPHFYLDSEFRGHFGHAMTEVMSRLWAWPAAKRAEPRLKALMCVNKGRDLAGWEATLFAAAGIDRDDIVMASGPVEVEKLLAATPMFSMPAYVHPDIAETWATVGRELAAQAPDRDYPKRVFCARRPGKRPCHNAAEVEALFADHGFEVVYPEDFPLPEQARIFREAEVIAGFAGSGLFSTCLSDSPKRVIMLSPASYTARNEYMIAAVLGHELDLVLSEPDPSYTGHYWESGFTFDFEREGVFLRDLLSAL